MRKNLFLLCLVFVGCKSKSPVAKDFAITDASISTDGGLVFEAATINCGLAPGVIDLATPRISVVAEEVRRMREEIGVICFEELWTQESKDAVVQALGPDAHTYYEDTRGENQRNGVNVCSPSQVKEVIGCSRNNCGQFTAEQQTICVFEKCKPELFKTFLYKAECLHCLVASVGKSVEVIVGTCVQQEGKPPIVGVSRAFDGQNGMLLASRWPLKNREMLRLRASFSNRVALFATIKPEGYESIEVVCAHISTRYEGLPPNHPDFLSWDEEMNSQFEDISKRLKERAGNHPSLFLGDMNAGPAIDMWIDREAPLVWKRIEELDFSSPATDAHPPFCSNCESNTLRIKLTDPKQRQAVGNNLIDHVLYQDPPGGMGLEPISAYPFFDQLRKFRGYNGEWVNKHLSDHYGVAVKFRLHTK